MLKGIVKGVKTAGEKVIEGAGYIARKTDDTITNGANRFINKQVSNLEKQKTVLGDMGSQYSKEEVEAYSSKYRPMRNTVPAIKDGANDYFRVNKEFVSTNPDNYSIPDRYKLTGYGATILGGTAALGAMNNTIDAAMEPTSTANIASVGTVNPVVSASSGLTPQNALDNMGASGDINFALRRNNIKAPGTL
jgi:hypothetical protein